MERAASHFMRDLEDETSCLASTTVELMPGAGRGPATASLDLDSAVPNLARERDGIATARLNPRSTALTVLAVVLALAVMQAAAGFLIPVVLSVLVAYALEPLVRLLGRLHVPRSLASALVVGLVIASLAAAAYALSGQALEALNRLPRITEQLRQQLRRATDEPAGPVRAITEAAADLEAAAREAAARTPAARTPGVGRVEIVEAPLSLQPSLIWGSVGALGMAGQVTMLVFFVYFALASAQRFREKIVNLAGPQPARNVAERVLDDVNRSVQRFLLVVVVTNVLVGVLTWIAFMALGVRQAAAWAVLGGVANTVPYFGSAVVACVYFAVAFVQFGTLKMAVVVASVFVVITSIEGMLVRPWLMSQQSGINSATVFVGLLFWGWLWGVWGLLLAFPITMIIKVVSDHVEGLRPVSELMGP